VLPVSVPAYDAPQQSLPATDLVFTSDGPSGMVATPTWRDPVVEALIEQRSDLGNPDPPPLHDDTVALARATAFLAQHGLDRPDLRFGEIVPGSSVTGQTTRILEWIVRYDQTAPFTADGTLPAGLSLRVGPTDRVWRVSWDLIEPSAEGQVPLRPLADVLADDTAWRQGSLSWDHIPGVTPPSIADPGADSLRVAVTDVELGYERILRYAPGDSEAQRLVPVYSFHVRALEPAASAGITGTWKVVAAAGARRD
jgi:hypothetical protein